MPRIRGRQDGKPARQTLRRLGRIVAGQGRQPGQAPPARLDPGAEADRTKPAFLPPIAGIESLGGNRVAQQHRGHLRRRQDGQVAAERRFPVVGDRRQGEGRIARRCRYRQPRRRIRRRHQQDGTGGWRHQVQRCQSERQAANTADRNGPSQAVHRRQEHGPVAGGVLRMRRRRLSHDGLPIEGAPLRWDLKARHPRPPRRPRITRSPSRPSHTAAAASASKSETAACARSRRADRAGSVSPGQSGRRRQQADAVVRCHHAPPAGQDPPSGGTARRTGEHDRAPGRQRTMDLARNHQPFRLGRQHRQVDVGRSQELCEERCRTGRQEHDAGQALSDPGAQGRHPVALADEDESRHRPSRHARRCGRPHRRLEGAEGGGCAPACRHRRRGSPRPSLPAGGGEAPFPPRHAIRSRGRARARPR